MTETKIRILELFQTLAPSEQRVLVEKLSEPTRPRSLLDGLMPEQRAKLEEGITQADAGDVMSAADIFDKLEMRLRSLSA
jgi:hypothetical protein